MNKRELVKAVAAESGFTGVEAARAANAMLRVIAQSLQRGERVSVPGFGAFSVRDRNRGQTGREVQARQGIAVRCGAFGRIEIRPERRPPLIGIHFTNRAPVSGSGRDQRRDAENLTEKYEKRICPRRIGRNPDARLGGCHGAGER